MLKEDLFTYIPRYSFQNATDSGSQMTISSDLTEMSRPTTTPATNQISYSKADPAPERERNQWLAHTSPYIRWVETN